MGEQLSTAYQQIPGTEMLEEPQDSVPTLEITLPTEPPVHDEQTISEGDCEQGTRSGNGPEASEEDENAKAKEVDIPTGSKDEESEDEENATEHQEVIAKTLGYTEHNGAGSHHHISNVNPAQAGVSLIPLDDFSSVDPEANNLAHMVCSKGERLSLTLERVDQELPYQKATPTLEATAWSALVGVAFW